MQDTVARFTYPTCQRFAEHAGSAFQLSIAQADTVILELTAVKPFPKSLDITDKSLKISSFSLYFSSTATPHLQQGSYALRHPVLGTMEMFIVPIGPSAKGTQYEAIFNLD